MQATIKFNNSKHTPEKGSPVKKDQTYSMRAEFHLMNSFVLDNSTSLLKQQLHY